MSTKHTIVLRSRSCDDDKYSESKSQKHLLELIEPLKSNGFNISVKHIKLIGYDSCFEVVVSHQINHVIQILASFCATNQFFYVMSVNSEEDS